MRVQIIDQIKRHKHQATLSRVVRRKVRIQLRWLLKVVA